MAWHTMTCVVVLRRCFHGIARAFSRAPAAIMSTDGKWQKLKLTKRAVESLKIKEKDYIVFDAELPGFGVRVMPSGKRFFLIQYRRYGRTRRVMIGQFGPITAENARREATRLLGQVRGGGGDPAALRDAERLSATVKELGQRFLKQHVATRCKPSTQWEYRRSVELFIDPFFGNQWVRSVAGRRRRVARLDGTYSIPSQPDPRRSFEDDEPRRDMGNEGSAYKSLRTR
jgi:hypothetical protein